MSESVSCLANVSHGYSRYLFTILDDFNTVAERALREEFETIGEKIGPENVIVKPTGGAMRDAATVFKIPDTARHPVLVITDFHPMALARCRQLVDANPALSRDLRERRFREAALHYPQLQATILEAGGGPDDLRNAEGKAITIELGSMTDDNRIRIFLSRLSTLVRNDDMRGVRLEELKERVVALTKHSGIAGVVVGIVGLFV